MITMDAFSRAIEAEYKTAMRAVLEDVNLSLFGGFYGVADKHKRGWPKQYGIVPGWLPVASRYHRARRWVRRWRREIRDRTDLAWRALKGEELWDW